MRKENVVNLLQDAVALLSVARKHGMTDGMQLTIDQTVRHALSELMKETQAMTPKVRTL